MFENSDHEWKLYGDENPYYGVISDDRLQQKNLNAEAMVQFWQSGLDHIDEVFHKIRQHIDPNFSPGQALDFGCGVGRLVFAIRTRCNHVTGIDVSPSMLAEAKRQATLQSIDQLTFIESSDCHELGGSLFDFLHSYIVFQHIPVARGNAILDRLLASLRSGGVGVLRPVVGCA